MNQRFEEELRASAYVHLPLPLHQERSLEARIENKPVLERRVLWQDGSLSAWQAEDMGKISLAPEGLEGGNCLQVRSPLWIEEWPEGTPTGAHYAKYGKCQCAMSIPAEDWSEWNRISFWVKPDFPARKNLTFIAEIVSNGKIKIPDQYDREGYHVTNVKNHEWNHLIWEFPDLPRDRVVKLVFYAFMNGRNGCTEDYMQFDVDGIELQRVAKTEYARGWQGDANRITYSTAGYFPSGAKTAVSTVDCDEFSLLDECGDEVFCAPAVPVNNERGAFRLLDFSDFAAEGVYRLKSGHTLTEPFPIGVSVEKEAVWKLLNFLYCERCGFPVPGVHGGCHFDAIAEHEGKRINYCGGWHDAGDLSQFMVQTAEIVHALFETAERFKEDAPLHARIIEEANWGLDFVLRTRFGDGFRCTSVGITRYSDGIVGTMDDITTVQVHDQSLDNFLCAGIEAYSAMVLQPEFAGRAAYTLQAAREDYRFALEKYRKIGYHPPIVPGEHTYPTGESHFYAIASWAATQLYTATADEEYAALAREFAGLLLECQETGAADIPLTGFFYRDKTHSSIVHANHQCREQVFMQALSGLAQTQKGHPDLAKWETAMLRYAGYLKALVPHSAPYGMIPAGVYRLDEAEDAATFEYMHRGSKYEVERDNYVCQVKNGVPIGRDHYIRRFPVWFSFRGNAACQLAQGKAAAILGNYFHDAELTQIGLEQLYWIFGKNPFGQSIMYGMGDNYAQLYATSSGELTGELPVGIESFENEDAPYWPQGNNCTYKEIWTTPAGRFLWVLAEVV